MFLGARGPLVKSCIPHVEPFHGLDGFGDNDFPPLCLKDAKNFSDEHGVLAICRLANEYESRLTLLALAPLTNLAMASKLDPDIGKKIGGVYIMGGNVEGLCAPRVA